MAEDEANASARNDGGGAEAQRMEDDDIQQQQQNNDDFGRIDEADDDRAAQQRLDDQPPLDPAHPPDAVEAALDHIRRFVNGGGGGAGADGPEEDEFDERRRRRARAELPRRVASDELQPFLDALTTFHEPSAQELPPETDYAKSADPETLLVRPHPDDRVERYFAFVARRGATCLPWAVVRPVFHWKIKHVLEEWAIFERQRALAASLDAPATDPLDLGDVDGEGRQLYDLMLVKIDAFDEAPFTIQRMCELLLEPGRHYTRAIKFYRALDKTVNVVMVVSPAGTLITGRPGDDQQPFGVAPSSGDDDLDDRPLRLEQRFIGKVDELDGLPFAAASRMVQLAPESNGSANSGNWALTSSTTTTSNAPNLPLLVYMILAAVCYMHTFRNGPPADPKHDSDVDVPAESGSSSSSSNVPQASKVESLEGVEEETSQSEKHAAAVVQEPQPKQAKIEAAEHDNTGGGEGGAQAVAAEEDGGDNDGGGGGDDDDDDDNNDDPMPDL